jgi:hypothetical protein
MSKLYARGTCPPPPGAIDKVIKQLESLEKQVDLLSLTVSHRCDALKKRITKVKEDLGKV